MSRSQADQEALKGGKMCKTEGTACEDNRHICGTQGQGASTLCEHLSLKPFLVSSRSGWLHTATWPQTPSSTLSPSTRGTSLHQSRVIESEVSALTGQAV